METFSQFKQKFYARQSDLSIFDCEDFNLLKVILDGLKVDYLKRGIYHQPIFQNTWLNALTLLAKKAKYNGRIRMARKKCKEVSSELTVPYFFFDNGRVSEDIHGEKVSFYFSKIERYLGSQNCTTLYQTLTSLKQGETISNLFLATHFDFYSREDKSFIRHLKGTYLKIERCQVFDSNELFNIRVAINKFFDEYRFWRFLLIKSRVKFALFDEHYHREGFILALKRKKIGAIELQHGLIAPEDIFYVFPQQVAKIRERALFPEKIFTYGTYWSDILKKGFEFSPSQIDVLGAYQEINTYLSLEQKKQMDHFLNGSSFVLITTQTSLHSYFVAYARWLSGDMLKKAKDVKIVVKIHPSEKMDDYMDLIEIENVRVFPFNTEYLLSRCSWHVSCYSTTLYDATKYNCNNYSLLIEQCKDYIDTFVNEGISTGINSDQSPLDTQPMKGSAVKFDKRTLYEDFENNKHKLKQLEI